MIKNEDRTTSPRMRIFFVIVAILLLTSTFAIYAGIVIGQDNKDAQSAVSEEKQQRLNELAAEHQAEVDKIAGELSEKYFDTFVAYKSRVKAFNAADVTELKTEDLKKGDGDKIEDGTENVDYSAYYIGWLSDGTIFDSSLNNTSLQKSCITNSLDELSFAHIIVVDAYNSLLSFPAARSDIGCVDAYT